MKAEHGAVRYCAMLVNTKGVRPPAICLEALWTLKLSILLFFLRRIPPCFFGMRLGCIAPYSVEVSE